MSNRLSMLRRAVLLFVFYDAIGFSDARVLGIKTALMEQAWRASRRSRRKISICASALRNAISSTRNTLHRLVISTWLEPADTLALGRCSTHYSRYGGYYHV